MFLKRIEMFGFKSFADRTVIDFTDGITALLGPNGCGKSNIVDAIKWVLGEQSVRNMRAEKMEDVIFSGTEGRKALSLAEVTLVIANETGILEIERPEIAIRRRLYRDGESDYAINGASVRLKELRELFFDTGVGKSAYSVMEQGKIDQVLSTKPEERRYLFEEAAGITKFKMRGGEAERKLTKTEENMAQVENILHEVRRRYESLKKQTEKTLQYRALKDRVFDLDRDLKLIQWRDYLDTKDKKKSRLESLDEKHGAVIKKIEDAKQTLENELDAINAMETKLIESQKRLYGMDLEKENLEDQVRRHRERKNEISVQLDSSRARENSVKDAVAELKERKTAKDADLKGFLDRLAEIEGNIISSGKTIEAADARISAVDIESQDLQKAIVDQETNRDALQDTLRSLTDDIVRELDRALSDPAFDRSRRSAVEKRITEILEEARIRLGGRLEILQDSAKSPNSTQSSDFYASLGEDLSGIGASLDEVSALFESYKGSGADFLDEFLAPEGIITQKRDLDEKILAGATKLKELRKTVTHLAGEKEQLQKKLADSRLRLEEFRVAQARTTTQVAAAQDALSALAREEEAENSRLLEIRRLIAEDESRAKAIDGLIAEVLSKREQLEKDQEGLKSQLAALETGITNENEKMAGRETALKDLTEQRGRMELDREKLRLEMGHVDEEILLLKDDFRDRNSRDLSEFEERMTEIQDSSKEIRERLSSTKGELKDLGQVNLMAPEEFTEVSERYEFLTGQLEDLRKAKDDLSQVTEEIRKESAALFMRTYKEIRDHFHEMFRRLFGGGRAEIKLVDPDDPLNSGVEIYAQPPGKKLENISLLSGGEKSLCGVALMFATYLVKPSPFCILDEIDAALDEANIQRFVNLLSEFGETSQFVVITHNKKTVAGARSLLGVTMQESGVSRLIAIRLDGQEQADEEPLTVD